MVLGDRLASLRYYLDRYSIHAISPLIARHVWLLVRHVGLLVQHVGLLVRHVGPQIPSVVPIPNRREIFVHRVDITLTLVLLIQIALLGEDLPSLTSVRLLLRVSQSVANRSILSFLDRRDNTLLLRSDYKMLLFYPSWSGCR